MQNQTLSHSRIHQLDNRLANQIAAGEVVERPASVVKELLENSIDAGASRIEVDIERGGTRLIRITDNGGGIVKEDLKLALSRHATSKISCSEDLGAISSLGFRGEALASIASVARLILTSRTSDSEFAWQAIAEGRDMSVKVQPASATIGTRIEVRDLFYNTPARQKFLRAEKTEFAHIEEIFKRHALANHSTAFILKHNHKVVRRIPAINHQTNILSRIEAICGKPFAQNAIEFDCQHELVNLKGWTGGAVYHRSESDIQYVFVNNRPVKDKMLNHAIRQAFQEQLPPGRMPTFVMFLEIDPTSIDVNVHPTKHEIRFDHQRMIHDLIVHSIMESLKENQLSLMSDEGEAELRVNSRPSVPSNLGDRAQFAGVGYSEVKYHSQPSSNHQTHHQGRSANHEYLLDNQLDKIFDSRKPNSAIRSTSELTESVIKSDLSKNVSDGHALIDVLGDDYLIINRNKAWFIVDAYGFLWEWLTKQRNVDQKLASEPLLFPKEVSIDSSFFEQLEVVELLQYFGFGFSPKDEQSVMLSKSPKWLRQVANDLVVDVFTSWAREMSEHFQSNLQAQSATPLEKILADALSEHAICLVPMILNQESRIEIETPSSQPVLLEQSSSAVKLTNMSIAKLFI